MANLASAIASYVSTLLTVPVGNDFQLDAVAQSIAAVPQMSIASVTVGNTPSELFEQSAALKYPTVSVYCDKLSNKLIEKFRTFSGTGRVVIEIRHSSNQVQNMQPTLETYVGAVCQILDSSRGDWGGGLFYAGGYDVTFNPVKRGGQNFLQSAKVGADVDVSL